MGPARLAAAGPVARVRGGWRFAARPPAPVVFRHACRRAQHPV